MLPNQRTELCVANLIEIIVPGQPPIRAQNWCEEDYFFCGVPYEFCNFAVTGVSRQLDLANTGSTITIGNDSYFDALRPLRDRLQAADGWRRALVRCYIVYPDDPNAPVTTHRGQILSSSIQGASINISRKSPVEAINAIVPSSKMTNQTVPELPRSSRGGI